MIWTVHDALADLGIQEFRFLLNSRCALYGLLEAYGVPDKQRPQVLNTLDKPDKPAPDVVVAELYQHGVESTAVEGSVDDLITAGTDRIRIRLDTTEQGRAGLAEIDRTLALAQGPPAGRTVFHPALVPGLNYYTGPI